MDHQPYDHASIPATLESFYGIPALTERDRRANSLAPLYALASARTDAPERLPEPATSPNAAFLSEAVPDLSAATVAAPHESVNDGNLPAIVHSAMQQDLAISPAEARRKIIARVASLRTRADAREYLAEVQRKIRPRRKQAASR